MTRKIAATILLSAVLHLLSVTGQDCKFEGWFSGNQTCSEGYTEVHRDQGKSGNFNLYCCLPGSEGEKNGIHEAPNCRVTKCITPSSSSLCSTLNVRYINGTKQEYQEEMRESCTRGTDGGQGVVAYCCRLNSPEGLLLTMVGAEENEFPHQAKLSACGGTVYNHRFIITASHCIVNNDVGSVKNMTGWEIFLGTNIGAMDSNAQEYVYKVKRVIPHEGYSKLASNPGNVLREHPLKKLWYNDIALVELEKDIQFSDKIKALEIAPERFDPFLHADRAVIVGWGKTDTLAMAKHLQKTNFVLRRDERCFQQSWSNYAKFQNQLLCLGGNVDGVRSWSTAKGDSGGPVVCRKGDGHPVLCGITSFGDTRCEQNMDTCNPSVFVEVSHFREWIKQHAGEQDPSTFYQPYLYGKEVEITEVPHQVRVTSSQGRSCGGTLIQPDIVVTAAHCVVREDNKRPLSDLTVSTTVSDPKGGEGKSFKVADTRVLPGFKLGAEAVNSTATVVSADNHYLNDLAVLKLEKSTSLKQETLPKLPHFENSFYRGVEYAYPRTRDSSPSEKLRSREFKLLDLHECQRRLDRLFDFTGQRMNVDKNLLCGVEKYSGGSTCDREYGGGLICTGSDGRDVLCGVQTLRLCMFSIPNRFVDMRLQGEWVENMINDMKYTGGEDL